MKSAASTLRKQLKDIQERKSKCVCVHVVFHVDLLMILASTFLEQWYLIYWPEEESYSEVPPSKLVEPKNPAVGDKVKVKDGKKVHTGEVVGFGSKMEIEELMLHLERDNEEETTAEREEGTVHMHVHVHYDSGIFFTSCMLFISIQVLLYYSTVYFFSTWSYGK